MAARNKFDVDEKLESSFNFKMIKKSLVYVSKEKKLFAIAIFCQITAIIVSLLGPIITANALDVSVPNKDVQGLLVNSALLIGTILVYIALTAVSTRVINIIGQNIIYNIRKDLYDHIQKLSFTYFDSRPHGKILVRVINYVNAVSNSLSNGLITSLLQFLNLIFIFGFMLFMDVKLTLVVVSGLPFVLLVIVLVKPLQRKGWQAYSNKSSNMNAYLNESIVCMKVTQIFAREKYNEETFHGLLAQAKKAWYKAAFATNTVAPAIDLISKTITVALLFVGIYLMSPMVSFGVLLAMIQYNSKFWDPILSLANTYNDFINSMAYLERIFETIDEPIAIKDVENAVDLPSIEGTVEFKNVSFGYDEGLMVLKNVSFTVKQGDSIALVGPTGAGKSTIINLISRFYDVTSGQILIDGIDISKVTLKSLREQMGIMMQDSFIFSGSIEDNIRYGKLDADIQAIKKAAQIVSADNFIEQMPDEYSSELKERGSRLSAGQKQLISFARTLVADPKILILDEATSSIDTKTEKILQNGLNKMLEGRTSFIVAHRLSTIRSCTKIMFIKDGRIAESGNHEELMAKKGYYYELCKSQLV